MNLLMVVMSMAVSFSTFSADAETAVPDFTASVYHQAGVFGVVLLPPASHHFNVDAPMSVLVTSKKINLSIIEKTKSRIAFEKEELGLTEADAAEVIAFLCDDAKTYCVKKKLSITLKSSIAKPELKSPKRQALESRVAPKKDDVKVLKPKKDAHGFWINAQAEAIAESARTQKPLLIDFYGIWCPPCNQYNEVVFPTKAFHQAAKNFVLLKIDADADASWELKSQFKIGGYPTLLVMKAPKVSDSIKQYEEIDRIVGYFPTGELVQKMNLAYINRNQAFESRVLAMKSGYVEGLQKLIEIKWEKKEFEAAAKYALDGLKLDSDNLYFQIVLLQNTARENEKKSKEREAQDLVKKIVDARSQASVETLMRTVAFLGEHAESFKDGASSALALIDGLSKRVNPKTLTVDGYELSLADINAMKVDVAETFKDEALLAKARKDTIAAYEKLISLQGSEARGLNLELAYWYWKDGRIADADQIYERFIKKYPREFTFYFAAARMNLDLKKFDLAKTQIEKAVEYSYGDNHLRSVERQVRVLTAAGEAKLAIEKGNAVLKQVKNPDGFAVRTDRYILALKKAVEAAEKGIK